MIIKTLKVGQLKTNCYLVIDRIKSSCFIIDPGDDAEYITRIIRDEEAVPKLILATHGHFDHILSVTELKLAFNVPFLIHQKDQFLVNRMQETAKHFLGISVDPAPTVDGYFKNGEVIRDESLFLRIIETPGHTPGSVSFYCESVNSIFVGDLIFRNGIVGRTDLSYSSPIELSKSIKIVMGMPEKTEVFSGHGDGFSLAEFKANYQS